MRKHYEVRRITSAYSLNWFDNNTNKRLKAVEIEEIINKQAQQIAELEEQLKNAIVPKFKIGQECWGIVPKTFWNKESYTIHFKVKAYIPDNNGIVLMLEDSITNLHYSYEWQVFANKEDALKKLEELQGE